MSGINQNLWNKIRQEVQEDYNREHPEPWSVHKVKTEKKEVYAVRPVMFDTILISNGKFFGISFDIDYSLGGMYNE
ncbi:MAG: hypothetical protein KKA65_03375 [Nanoarchaeota archaeon]|nr:hypothetical protein [Nanoarchaeota archaeon]MBU4242197.1 hypothetical protein [Nanoarchaeota archaeon]MBU4352036.1 hypothetical protein [Nanoarchaeota archaeon]MBU4456519.1 hypothetical protein [Nanoarchaeota archaeon]MCG2719305.1 hypothetical protein [Nanoarchaeota archaeon]